MYKLTIRKSAAKCLDKIPNPAHKNIEKAILSLADDPRPYGYIHLAGVDSYRIRVGDYRIIYAINDIIEVVDIEYIAHRKDVYRRLNYGN